ncbi:MULTISPECIES: RHS repeat domain-containing protein [unclassified Pseudomonas]|uniref:RHS repeat-associated core domain-containing protein n=1 Tax=Pseudomonas sp. MYb327 TaxID=2745230 RepID=A0AAU8DYF6_9PSED
MPATARSLDYSTPAIMVIEPRGLIVRKIMYCRNVAGGETETRVTRQVYNHAAQQVANWDPRLLKLAESQPDTKANLTSRFTMTGASLFTDSVDAGWRLALMNDAGGACRNWDSRGTQRHTEYDFQLRPVAVIEHEKGGEPKTVERFTFEANRQPSAEHNSCGRLIRHDDTAGTREIPGYDLHGQPLGETRRFLNQLQTPSWPQELPLREQLLGSERFTSSDRFSPTGEQLETIDARGNCQLHQYNLSGQPNQIKLRLFKGPEHTVLSEIRYNALGQMESETAGNGVISRAEYRPEDGRLLRLVSLHSVHPVLQDLSYDYDPVGNIVRIEESALTTLYFNNQQTRPESIYCYDTLYQLIKSTGRESCLPTPGACLPDYQPLPPDPTQMANYVQTFDYDKGGNLRKLVHVGARQYSRHMSTAPESNRSLSVPVDGSEPDFSASFDLNGNLKRLQAGPEMDWDLRNQLQEVTLVCRPDGANDREQYVYDGGGQRVRKITTTQAKNVIHFAEVLYLRDLEIRTNSASNEILHVINVHTGRGSVRVLHWESPPPQNVDNDQLRYGLSDHLGSGALELDESAQVLSREGYYPYGGTAWFAARSETEGKYKTIRYSGKERDVSGLYYYGFRYYIAWWCRWLNPDPIGVLGGMNLYQMVRNNPVVNIDPDGHMERGVGQPGAQRTAPPPVPARPQSTLTNSARLLAQSTDSTRQIFSLEDILKLPTLSKDKFEKTIVQLLETSQAADFQSINDFIEAGQGHPNRDLRKLANSKSLRLKDSTTELINELHKLGAMEEKLIAYRSIKTTEMGIAELQKKGNLVTDLGIQSASVTRKNAEDWGSGWAKDASKVPRDVMIIFGADVPKTNLATGFLIDHVAILPAEKLEVADSELKDGKLYVLLTKPTSANDINTVFTIFDGTIINNLSEIQSFLRSVGSA